VLNIYGAAFLPPDPEENSGRSCRRALWSMTSGVVIVNASPLTVPRACPRPVAPVDGMTVTAEGVVPCVG